MTADESGVGWCHCITLLTKSAVSACTVIVRYRRWQFSTSSVVLAWLHCQRGAWCPPVIIKSVACFSAQSFQMSHFFI